MNASSKGHVCLKHCRDKAKHEVKGDLRNKTSKMVDWMAFLPDPVFSVADDVFLTNLCAGGISEKLKDYMMGGRGIGSFHAKNGRWTANWQSSHELGARGKPSTNGLPRGVTRRAFLS